mgnify:CR=1 FL=1|tara:strand:- start:577 stop:1335 length:759 start_codon:yes stop_codon:yes gene_type:complete
MKFHRKFRYASAVASFLSYFYKKKNNAILLYHSIRKMDFNIDNNLDVVDIDIFSNQMKLLSSNKDFENRICPLSLNLKKHGSISITFDDGYLDNIENVFPIINKYNIPITIFICIDLIGKDGYLKKSDIEFLSKQKNITIGSHSFLHKPLENIEISQAKEDLFKSKNILQDITNKKTNLFSYPHGSFNNEILDMIKKNNIFDIACCSINKTFVPNNITKFLLPRIPIWYLDNQKSFLNKLNSYWDWISYLNK